VEDFVDFLRQRDDEHRLAKGVARASEASFAKAWDNEADGEYDNL
jgi:hypothetical protein